MKRKEERGHGCLAKKFVSSVFEAWHSHVRGGKILKKGGQNTKSSGNEIRGWKKGRKKEGRGYDATIIHRAVYSKKPRSKCVKRRKGRRGEKPITFLPGQK